MLLLNQAPLRKRGGLKQIIKPMDLRELPDTREVFSGNISMLRDTSIAM